MVSTTGPAAGPGPDPATGPGIRAGARLQEAADDAVGLLGVAAAAVYLRPGRPSPVAQAAAWACGAGATDPATAAAIRSLRVTADATGSPAGSLVVTGVAALAGSDPGGAGWLCVFDPPGRRLAARDVALLGLLAGRAALAVDNARLVDALDETEKRHRFVLDRLPDVVWAADAERVITYISAGCERLTGWRPEEVVGRDASFLMHESSRDRWEAGYRWQVAHPGGEQTYRVALRHRDGRPVEVEMHSIGTPADGSYGGGTGSVREMTERDRLERELQAQAAELAAGRVRGLLAQELHDSVTQALFSMTLTTGAARMLLDQGRPGVEDKLDELKGLAREALAEMRNLIFELRPGSLAEEGFLPALRRHVTSVEARTGLVVRVEADTGLGRLPLEVEDALYRITQEAVHNVAKHAAARRVELRLARSGTAVTLTVADDGAGFDPRARSGGLGLAGMASRAERLGGTLEVDASPGHGTTVRVSIPLDGGPLVAGVAPRAGGEA